MIPRQRRARLPPSPTGAKLRDAINFFKDPDGPFQQLIDVIKNSGGTGPNNSDLGVFFAADAINDALRHQ